MPEKKERNKIEPLKRWSRIWKDAVIFLSPWSSSSSLSYVKARGGQGGEEGDFLLFFFFFQVFSSPLPL